MARETGCASAKHTLDRPPLETEGLSAPAETVGETGRQADGQTSGTLPNDPFPGEMRPPVAGRDLGGGGTFPNVGVFPRAWEEGMNKRP